MQMDWRSSALKKFPAPTTFKTSILIFFLFVLAAFISSCFIHTSTFLAEDQTEPLISSALKIQIPSTKSPEFPLNCTILNRTKTCPRNYYPESFEPDPDSTRVCPEFFRWIHEDLRPWAKTGISKDMVERANRTATFRLAIVKGRAYLVRNRKSIQTRDVFTIWGILQLLRKYPGKLPDLELMFDTDDQPVVKSRDYRRPNSPAPPPLFRYCGDRWTLDIVFPDWSFWGWAEINIKPWESILKDIKVGNNRTGWMDREPYAYWKGNPFVAPTRQDLLRCNISDNQHVDWKARIYIQDWIKEGEQGFKQSDLANQCTHRYKIYVEGYAWSVSEKYILACDSMTLFVGPKYYDFFIRSMQPVHHYWPIRDTDKCKSIKFAVDWANSHKRKAQEIGRAGSRFMQEELKMENVYDYMYHLLNEYSKLLTYEVKIPEGGVEVCGETMACNADEGREKLFMMESLVKSPSAQSPCSLAPPFEPHVLATFLRRKFASIHQVEKWEDNYWHQSTNLTTTN